MSAIVPEICSCAALRQATRRVSRLYDAALAPAGIGVSQYSIIAKLDRYGPHSLQQLAERLVMDRSSLGHLLRPLEKRRLISLGFADDDKRRRVIAHTEKGVELLSRARALWERAEARFGDAYGSDDAIALRTALKRVESVMLARA